MTSERSVLARRAGLLVLGLLTWPAMAAEPTYPFEGSWLRANRVCAPNAPYVRTYSTRELNFAGGRCSFRKVASGSGQFEIFEDCRHAEHPGDFRETIRMLGPDLMTVRRQAARLKIARSLRYVRCTVAAPSPPKPAAPPPAAQPH